MSAVLTNPPRLDRLQVENAMAAMSDADWRRVEFIASSLSHGFTGFEPEDLILEAQTKLIEGVRVWPTGVPAVVVLENVMSSIASNARKRRRAASSTGACWLSWPGRNRASTAP